MVMHLSESKIIISILFEKMFTVIISAEKLCENSELNLFLSLSFIWINNPQKEMQSALQ